MATIQNIRAALASSSNVAWLPLLTITAPSGTLRVVANSVAITSRGNVYEPYPFEVTLPQDDSESLPRVALSLSNLDAAIVEFIRESLEPPKIAVELVTSSDPDNVEVSLNFLKLGSVSYDALVVTGQLDVDNFLTQKFPGEAYVPPLFPGLFR